MHPPLMFKDQKEKEGSLEKKHDENPKFSSPPGTEPSSTCSSICILLVVLTLQTTVF